MTDLAVARTDTAPVVGIARRLRHRTQLLAGVVLALVVGLRAPAEVFLFDAADYWGGAAALLGGGDVFGTAHLELRGALTPLMYLPAALVARLAGESAAGDAVLAQNAVLIGVIGAVLLPRLVGIWRPVTSRVVWLSALGCGLTLSGFAPYPLSDLGCVALLIAAVVAVDARWRGALAAGGLAAGVAINLRPAYLLPVGAVCFVVLVARRLRGLEMLAGIGVALLPQAVLNRIWGVTWIPWPERTGELSGIQAYYASFVVRYDTFVTPDRIAQLSFCDPVMAADVTRTRYVNSSGDLAAWFLAHLPHSALFGVQKVAATLHWPVSTPYLAPTPLASGLFGVLVTAIAVAGALGLGRATLRHGWRFIAPAQVAAALVWAGTVVTLVTSAPETRFALPLVMLGTAGCVVLVTNGFSGSRRPRVWAAGVLLAVGAVYGLGAWGMAHPATGLMTGAICAVS